MPLDVEEHGRFCIFSLRFSADGFEILGGANDGYIYLYDRIKQGTCLKIEAHEDDVNAVAFVDSATHILASGGDDGLVKIWDRRSLREDRPKPGKKSRDFRIMYFNSYLSIPIGGVLFLMK